MSFRMVNERPNSNTYMHVMWICCDIIGVENTRIMPTILIIPSQNALVVEVKYWRTNREAPAAAGVAIDVPVQAINKF